MEINLYDCQGKLVKTLEPTANIMEAAVIVWKNRYFVYRSSPRIEAKFYEQTVVILSD